MTGPTLPVELGADGVHIGQQDMPYAQARKLVGDGAIVGVTCHDSRHLAMEAGEAGADYVAFGAFYPTETKDPAAQGRAGPADLVAGDDGTALCRHRRHHGRTTPARWSRRERISLAVSAGVWRAQGGPARRG